MLNYDNMVDWRLVVLVHLFLCMELEIKGIGMKNLIELLALRILKLILGYFLVFFMSCK